MNTSKSHTKKKNTVRLAHQIFSSTSFDPAKTIIKPSNKANILEISVKSCVEEYKIIRVLENLK